MFDLVFFDFGHINIKYYQSPIVAKWLFKIVVIVTVPFLNFILLLNGVLFCYLNSLYACLGIHTLRIHCLMAMFVTINVL